MGKYLKYLLVLVLAIAVFAAAKYLDSSPIPYAQETSRSQTEQAESGTTVSFTEQTDPTEPPETTAEQSSVESVTDTPTEPATEAAALQERFVLTFAGDCTPGSNSSNYDAQHGFIQTIGDNYAYPFEEVASYFASDDLTLVNLEGVLGDYAFSDQNDTFLCSSAYARILADNSVEAVNLANDHTDDFGDEGYAAMIQLLDNAGVQYLERDCAKLITTESGLTVGLYATMFYSIDVEDMKLQIAQLRQQGAELVIVSAHWGVENLYSPRVIQVNQAHAAIDAGADIVFGHHPKTLHPVEEYNGGIIYYSLGNFCFGPELYPTSYDSALLQQEVIREPDGTVHLGELTAIPISISANQQRNDFQPVPYAVDSDGYRRTMEALNLG